MTKPDDERTEQLSPAKEKGGASSILGGVAGDPEEGSEGKRDLLPILPLRNAVLFPTALMPIVVGRPKTVRLLKHIEEQQGLIGVLPQKDKEVEDPQPEDFHGYGTAARIRKVMKGDDDETFHVIVHGQRRFRVIEAVQTEPFLIFRVEWVPNLVYEPGHPEVEALARAVKEAGNDLISLIPELPGGAAELVSQIEEPPRLIYLVLAHLGVPVEEKVKILAEPKLESALRETLRLLHHQIEVLRLSQKINKEVKGEMDRNQREFVLRQQLKAIQRELGELEGAESDIDELEERLMQQELPQEARKAVDKELRRLRMLQPASPEYSVTRTWLEWIADLPFSEVSEDRIEIDHAREILDEDHYDLDKVKKRILEFLAVRKLNPDMKGPILCLVGPPGVGKTSLGQSIARAIGRKFIRVSLGGVRDEAEIRGHRRTYVGAMPGKIIQQLRRVDVMNPVMMLDEVDKLGRDWRGDPTSALLEVLDPEQNHTFMDHYLDVPYDLSRVMFITTANQTDTIPRPLLDRMEVIELPGYTHHEKSHIAKGHLIPRQIERHGLDEEQFDLADDGLDYIIDRYTREAGVRNLERRIADLCRAIAVTVVTETFEPGEVDRDRVKELRARVRRAHRGQRCGHGHGLDPDRRRHPLRRGHAHVRQRQGQADRQARRGDEGVGGDRHQPGQGPRRRPRHRGVGLHRVRRAHPRPRRRHPQGRAERRHHPLRGPRLPAHGHQGQGRRRHDRGDHAPRPDAARRRHQGEGARGAAWRHHRDHPARAQPQGPLRHPRGRQGAAHLPLHLAGRRGPRARAAQEDQAQEEGQARGVARYGAAGGGGEQAAMRTSRIAGAQ